MVGRITNRFSRPASPAAERWRSGVVGTATRRSRLLKEALMWSCSKCGETLEPEFDACWPRAPVSYSSVNSRGATLQGFDQALVPLAEQSFNTMALGAVLLKRRGGQ